MDDHFAGALRAALIEHVTEQGAEHRARSTARRRQARLRVVVGAVTGLAVLGGGVAVAAAGGWFSLPGSDVVTTSAPAVTVTRSGTATVELGAIPSDATDVTLQLSCLTAGTFTFSDGASMICSASDAGTRQGVTTYRLPLAPGQHSITITSSPATRWTLIATFAHVEVSEWGRNADGLTYGVQNAHGTPDLIAVTATNGREGYAFDRDLDPPPPTGLQTGPEPARTIPVFTSDGHTRIGVFVIGGDPHEGTTPIR
ncbi:hypothetical protein [Lapillicoccus jejuensis]|nr:hypothetical protein [Lapillicoccus jejuensis]